MEHLLSIMSICGGGGVPRNKIGSKGVINKKITLLTSKSRGEGSSCGPPRAPRKERGTPCSLQESTGVPTTAAQRSQVLPLCSASA